MIATRISNRSTIIDPAYDFDDLGNQVMRNARAYLTVGIDIPTPAAMQDHLIGFEISNALDDLGNGWVNLDEGLGSGSLAVKINQRTLQTFTFCDGQASLVCCSNALAFAARVAYEREFYEVHNPPYTLIDDGDTPRIFDHQRKTFIV